MVSNKFQSAFGYILSKEGGYSNNPLDRGGITNYGIAYNYQAENLKKYGINSTEELKHITFDQVQQFYKNEFWDKYGIDQIKDPSVAAKFFDFAIATGRTLKSVGGVELLNKLSPSEAMARIAQVHRDVYLATIKKHPEQASFWAGWDKRTRSIPGDKTYLPTDIFKQIQDKITTATGPELLASTTTVPSGNYAKTHDTINYDNKLSFFENASKSADLTNAIDNLYNKVIQNASKDQLEYVMLKLLGHTQAYYANIQGT